MEENKEETKAPPTIHNNIENGGGNRHGHSCILFVGNISTQADDNYLRRLFAAYGVVKSTKIVSSETSHQYGLVEYSHPDDADCAVASLHLRYCMAPGVPVIVLYQKSSPVVSEYGKLVGTSYREAVEGGTDPLPVPLDSFDTHHPQRAVVNAPSTDLRPVAPYPQQSQGGREGTVSGQSTTTTTNTASYGQPTMTPSGGFNPSMMPNLGGVNPLFGAASAHLAPTMQPRGGGMRPPMRGGGPMQQPFLPQFPPTGVWGNMPPR